MQRKDSLPILESRIIDSRRTKEVPVGYSNVASLMPELYLDPNEMARCREKIELADLLKAKTTTATAMIVEKIKDSVTKQASVETTVKD